MAYVGKVGELVFPELLVYVAVYQEYLLKWAGFSLCKALQVLPVKLLGKLHW
jgi:hypothetical protein